MWDKIDDNALDELRNSGYALMLRTCAPDMTSHDGFRWPVWGPVRCYDWDPHPSCGHGLHGLLWGEGGGDLLNWDSSARWLVVAVMPDEVVDLADKVKVPRGWVVHCGDQYSATDFLRVIDDSRATAGKTTTAGDYGTATAGHSGTATAGNSGTATAGDYGTATAGDHGTATAGHHGTATAGSDGTATAGADGTATAGDGGTATAGESGTAMAGHRGTATAGDYGTAMAGESGTAMAGKNGTIVMKWWDEAASRYRTVVGYPGENDIEVGKRYRVDNYGNLVVVGETLQEERARLETRLDEIDAILQGD